MDADFAAGLRKAAESIGWGEIKSRGTEVWE
jgi:hypothetical protein